MGAEESRPSRDRRQGGQEERQGVGFGTAVAIGAAAAGIGILAGAVINEFISESERQQQEQPHQGGGGGRSSRSDGLPELPSKRRLSQSTTSGQQEQRSLP